METKRQEEIKKLMQMPEETITNLSESEADQYGRLVLMFYKKTGDESYRKKAEQIRAGQKELPENVCAMPFFMEYETVCGKKECYNQIVERMEKEAEKGFADAGERDAYLAALVDVIDGISFEIYEKYRELITVYKHVLKEALAEEKETSELSYAILKGCRMGILLKEKYARAGMQMAEHLKNTGAAVQTDGFSNIAARVSEQYDMLAKELTEQGGKEEWM